MKSRTTAIGLVSGLAILLAGIDQGIKGLVSGTLSLHESRVLIPGFLSLTHRQNTGVAFSLFHDASPWVLQGVTIVILGVLLWLASPYLRSRGWVAAAGLIFGGALGNLVDRVRLQAVIDYLDVHLIVSDRLYSWPTFNLADVCVVIGVILLGFLLIRSSEPAPAGPVEENAS